MNINILSTRILKRTFIFTLSLISAIAFGQAKTKTPSSTIPDRREFPLNNNINPCEDFHKYVCSNVESSFKMREDRSRHMFAFDDSAERLLNAKKSFFKKIEKEKSLSERGLALKNYYLACMNAKSGKSEELKWIKAYQKDLDAISSQDEFLNYQFQNLQNGKPSFWGFAPSENSDNPNIYDLYLGMSFMSLPDHSYYQNKELMNEYQKLMIDFFKIILPKKEHSSIPTRVQNILEFETQFIKTYPPPEVRRQRWSEKRQLTQTQFLEQFKNLKGEMLFSIAPKDILLKIPIPEGLAYLNQVLDAKNNSDKVMATQNLQTLKDYFFFHELSGLLDDAFPTYYTKRFAFNKKFLGGPNTRPDRQERCTTQIMHTFPKELDEILLPRLFPDFPEEKFKLVADKIRESILKGVEENNWLSRDAKKEAHAKMKTARLQLIKPNNEREWDFSPTLKYSTQEKISNQIILSAALFKKQLQEMGEPTNLDRWGMGPLTVNAYYDATANKFVMPIGILQYPFFDTKGSLIENLGAVGVVIGHELGHGIDDEGSKYDHTGKLRQWMTMKDLTVFTSKTSKLVEQYNKIGHNGRFTLGENVADLVGVTFGYNAAFPKNEGSIEDKKKFFESYGRLWCLVMRPQYEELQLKSNPHAMGWARINEPVKHLSGFYEAYQCKAGDKMFLPESERVKIW